MLCVPLCCAPRLLYWRPLRHRQRCASSAVGCPFACLVRAPSLSVFRLAVAGAAFRPPRPVRRSVVSRLLIVGCWLFFLWLLPAGPEAAPLLIGQGHEQLSCAPLLSRRGAAGRGPHHYSFFDISSRFRALPLSSTCVSRRVQRSSTRPVLWGSALSAFVAVLSRCRARSYVCTVHTSCVVIDSFILRHLRVCRCLGPYRSRLLHRQFLQQRELFALHRRRSVAASSSSCVIPCGPSRPLRHRKHQTSTASMNSAHFSNDNRYSLRHGVTKVTIGVRGGCEESPFKLGMHLPCSAPSL